MFSGQGTVFPSLMPRRNNQETGRPQSGALGSPKAAGPHMPLTGLQTLGVWGLHSEDVWMDFPGLTGYLKPLVWYVFEL